MDTFAILNIIALGVLAGTTTGLAIGFVANRQKPSWSAMTAHDKRVNIALVLFFIVAFILVLFWYAMNPVAAAFP
jgi:uncharacterized BrkB/YihY/UPF0761 family membrane protein